MKFIKRHIAEIDEFQYAPELLPFVKMSVDRQNGECGLFGLTGSQQFKLMQNVSESLAGRVGILPLGGVTQSEENEVPFDGPFSAGRLLDAPLWFYRDKAGTEVDLLIEQDGKLTPIEIKRTATPRLDMVRSFRTVSEKGVSLMPGGIVCLAERAVPLPGGVKVVPVGSL